MKCWHYDPIDRSGKENCGNCFRWTGIECENHEALIEGWQTRESDAIDKMIRSNKGVWVD